MSRQYRSYDAADKDRHETEVYAVDWLSSGPVVSGSLDGEVAIWTPSLDEVEKGTLNTSSSSHKGIRSISSSANGTILVSDLLGMATLWRAIQGNRQESEEEAEANGGPAQVWHLKKEAEGQTKGSKMVLRASDGSNARYITPPCHVTQLHPTQPIFAATGPWAGATIYSTQLKDGLTQFNPVQQIHDDGEIPRKTHKAKTEPGHFGQSIRFDAVGARLAVGTDNGSVSIYDVESGSTMTKLTAHPAITRAIEFTKSGELLVGSDHCSITMYDLREPQWTSNGARNASKYLHEMYVDTLQGHNFWITDVKIDSDDRYVATSSADGHVKVWDLRSSPTRQAVFQTKEGRPVWSLCWKPHVGATSFISGGGIVSKASDGKSPISSGSVRWYQVSGTSA